MLQVFDYTWLQVVGQLLEDKGFLIIGLCKCTLSKTRRHDKVSLIPCHAFIAYLFLSSYYALDDSVGIAILFHGVETFDGATAWSGNLVDGFASGCYI